MNGFTRNYFFELSEDKQSLVIGTNWDLNNKLNQIGLITKSKVSAVYVDFEFKLPNGLVIRKEKAGIDEILTEIRDYLSKDDLINLCSFLYLWG